MKDRAQKKVEEILNNHVPQALDKSVEKKLKQIAENA
jgi:trimethylamine:corrinoid methyltransferase-like protein